MYLSIVTSMYRSEDFIKLFVERMEKEAKKLTDDFEIVLVNDGCPGNSLEAAKDLLATRDYVRLIELSRNFGHHTAFFAGLEAAIGDVAFLIDCDLEESPEWLSEFHQVLIDQQADLVYGVQEKRPSGIRQGVSETFYKVFNILSETKIPNNVCTVRIMTREFRDAIVSIRERNLFLAGIYAWAGFRQKVVPVSKDKRHSASNYSIRRTFKLLVDAITSFSPLPLYLSFFTGLFLSGSAGLFGTVLVVRKLVSPESILPGYVSIMTSVFFVGGLTILMMGIIGIYLSRMFIEVKQRPHYFVRKTYGYPDEESSVVVVSEQ